MAKRTPLEGAERKGRKAFEEGKPITACPYRDNRTYYGAVTWSRSFITAWRDGWKAAQKESNE